MAMFGIYVRFLGCTPSAKSKVSATLCGFTRLAITWLTRGMPPPTCHDGYCSTRGLLQHLSGQTIIFHQPRFPWNKGSHFPSSATFWGPRSCIIWPDLSHSLTIQGTHHQQIQTPQCQWFMAKNFHTSYYDDSGSCVPAAKCLNI